MLDRIAVRSGNGRSAHLYCVRIAHLCLLCWQGPVFIYYSLTNYYQNHRRYVKSRSDTQLRGADISYSSLLSSDCAPFIGNSTSSKAYAPCGAIANSLFNGKRRSLPYCGVDDFYWAYIALCLAVVENILFDVCLCRG